MAIPFVAALGCYDPQLAGGDAAGAGADAGTGDAREIVTVAAAADSWLEVAEPDTPHGIDTTLYFGEDDTSGSQVAILRFDLSAVPARTVSRVWLRFWATNGSSDAVMTAYRLEWAWSEDVATWSESSSGVPWPLPGAGGAARGMQLAQFEVPDLLVGYRIPLLVEVAQGWLDDPATNHGLLIAGVGGNAGMASSEDAAADRGPELELELGP